MFEPKVFKSDSKIKNQYVKEVDFSKMLLSFLKNRVENPEDIINSVSQDSRKFLSQINKEISESIKRKSYQNHIYSENPKITPEIKKKIHTNNRDFLQDLLVNCNSEKNFKFWLNNGIILTEDIAVLAVLLRSKKPILKVLYEKGCFKNMKDGNKIELFEKADRLSEGSKSERESFDYLKNILFKPNLTKTM